MTEQQTESGYVFEFIGNNRLLFRSADMDNPKARYALGVLLSALYGADIFDEEFDSWLAGMPRNRPFLTIFPQIEDGEISGFDISTAKREPGVNSGRNSVITDVKVTPRN
jgi:hypothetical protein